MAPSPQSPQVLNFLSSALGWASTGPKHESISRSYSGERLLGFYSLEEKDPEFDGYFLASGATADNQRYCSFRTPSVLSTKLNPLCESSHTYSPHNNPER